MNKKWLGCLAAGLALAMVQTTNVFGQSRGGGGGGSRGGGGFSSGSRSAPSGGGFRGGSSGGAPSFRSAPTSSNRGSFRSGAPSFNSASFRTGTGGFSGGLPRSGNPASFRSNSFNRPGVVGGSARSNGYGSSSFRNGKVGNSTVNNFNNGYRGRGYGYGGYGGRSYGYGRYGYDGYYAGGIGFGIGLGRLGYGYTYGLGYGGAGYRYSPYYSSVDYSYSPYYASADGSYTYPGYSAAYPAASYYPPAASAAATPPTDNNDLSGFGNDAPVALASTPMVNPNDPTAALYEPSAFRAEAPPPGNPATAAAADQAAEFAAQGEQQFKAEDYDGAVRSLRHALLDDRNNGRATLLLGQAFLAQGQYGAGAGAVQEGLRLVNPQQWGDIVGNYPTLYRTNDAFTKQLRALETAITKNPSAPALRFLAGYEYGFLGYPKEAVAELDQVVKLAPADAMAKKMRDYFAPKIGTSFDKRAAASARPPTNG